ncbi:MAG: hypothetical protein A2711_14575 [Burkholderiales bacterium RIFCSPHIGHO2_01_FULL_63_240]|nr:MAG: hypothetical protein A2711_14575 [Burkholderiales bacterium RIFCSPHIGHO2_01_FULL_63_240]
MSSEKNHASQEEVLRLAIRHFAAGINAGRGLADISALVQATSPLPLMHLAHWEQMIRDEFTHAVRSPTRHWREAWVGQRRFLTWIDLVSWDGYVRERVLRTLSGPVPNGFFFVLALRRLNDWVPQVRAAAREKLPQLARDSMPEHVAEALCAMLSTWTSWGRLDEVDRRILVTLLDLPKVDELVKHKVISSAAGPMAFMLSQVTRSEVLDGHLPDIAEKAVQPAVRAFAYRALLAGKVVWVKKQQWTWTDVSACKGRMQKILDERPLVAQHASLTLLTSALADRSPIVRRIAGEVLVREAADLGDAALPLVRQLAADASPGLAERGAFILRSLAPSIR